MLCDTFFYINELARLSKSASYPTPKTDLSVVSLTPRNEQELRANPRLMIQRKIFLSEREHLTVEKVIREATAGGLGEPGQATRSKKERNRISRRRNRQELRGILDQLGNGQEGTDEEESRQDIIKRLDLSSKLLSTPFSHLDNSSIRAIGQALTKRYG